MNLTRYLIVVLTLSLGACATQGKDKFACPHPQGVTCMSPTQIYRETDTKPHLEQSSVGKDAGSRSDDGRSGATRDARQGFSVDNGGLTLTDVALHQAANDTSGEPTPFRTPSHVLRIWVAPWEDNAGDLHLATRVFTEIEGRRWLVGEREAVHGNKVMQLMSQPAVVRTDSPTLSPSASQPPAGHPNNGALVKASNQ